MRLLTRILCIAALVSASLPSHISSPAVAQSPLPFVPVAGEWRFLYYDHFNSGNLFVQPSAPVVPANTSQYRLALRWQAQGAYATLPSTILYEEGGNAALFVRTSDRLSRYDLDGQLIWRSAIINNLAGIANIRSCVPGGPTLVALVSTSPHQLAVHFVDYQTGVTVFIYRAPNSLGSEFRSAVVDDYDNDGWCEIYPSLGTSTRMIRAEFNSPNSVVEEQRDIGRTVTGYPISLRINGAPYLAQTMLPAAAAPAGVALAPANAPLSTTTIVSYNIPGVYAWLLPAAVQISPTHDAVAVFGILTSTFRLDLVSFNGVSFTHTTIATDTSVSLEVVGAQSRIISEDVNNDGVGDILVRYADAAGTVAHNYYLSNGGTWAPLFTLAQSKNPDLSTPCEFTPAESGGVERASRSWIKQPGRPTLLAFCGSDSGGNRGFYTISGTTLSLVHPLASHQTLPVGRFHRQSTRTSTAAPVPPMVDSNGNPNVLIHNGTTGQVSLIAISYTAPSFSFTPYFTTPISFPASAIASALPARNRVVVNRSLYDSTTSAQLLLVQESSSEDAYFYVARSLHDAATPESLVLHRMRMISFTHASMVTAPTILEYGAVAPAFRHGVLDFNGDGRLEYIAAVVSATNPATTTFQLRQLGSGQPPLLSYDYPSAIGAPWLLGYIPNDRVLFQTSNRLGNAPNPLENSIFALSPSGSLLWQARGGTSYIGLSPSYNWGGSSRRDFIRYGGYGPIFAVLDADNGAPLYPSLNLPNVLGALGTTFHLSPYPVDSKEWLVQDTPIRGELTQMALVRLSPPNTPARTRYDPDREYGALALADVLAGGAPTFTADILAPTIYGLGIWQVNSAFEITRGGAIDLGYAVRIEDGRCVQAYPDRGNALRRDAGDAIRAIQGCQAKANFSGATQIVAVRTSTGGKAIIAAGSNGILYVFSINPSTGAPSTLYTYPLFRKIVYFAVADINADGLAEIYALDSGGDVHALEFVSIGDHPPVRQFRDGWEASDIDAQSSTTCYRAAWERPLTTRQIVKYRFMLRDEMGGAPLLPTSVEVADTNQPEYAVEVCTPQIIGRLLDGARYFGEVLVVYGDGRASQPAFTDGVVIQNTPALNNSSFTAHPQIQRVGAAVAWTLTLSNTGAVPVTAFAQIPVLASLSLLGLSADAGLVQSLPGGIAWSGVPLPPNSARTLVFTTTSSAPQTVNLSAVVAFEDEAFPEIEFSASATYVQPDLSGSSKSASGSTYLVGEALTYSIALSNASPITASVFVTDPLPNNLVLQSLSASAGLTTAVNAGVVSAGGLIPPNQSRQLTITARAVAPTNLLENCAWIREGNATLRRCAPVSIMQPQSAVVVDKSAAPLLASPGGLVTYTIRITNAHHSPVSLSLADAAPAGVVFVTQQGGLNLASTLATWSGVLLPSQSASFTLVAAMPVSTGIVLNTVVVSNPLWLESISASAAVVLEGTSDVRLGKDSVVSSDAITYVIRLTNTGTLPANALFLRSPLATNAGYVPGAHQASAGNLFYDAPSQELRWSGGLPPSGSATITWTVSVASAPAGATHYHNALLYSNNALIAQAPSIHVRPSITSGATIRVRAVLTNDAPVSGVLFSFIAPVGSQVTRDDGRTELAIPFAAGEGVKDVLIYPSNLTGDLVPLAPNQLVPNLAAGETRDVVYLFLSPSSGQVLIQGVVFYDANEDGNYNYTVDGVFSGHPVFLSTGQVATTTNTGNYALLTSPSSVVISSPVPVGHLRSTTPNPTSLTPITHTTHNFGFARCDVAAPHCAAPPAGYTWVYGYVYNDADGRLNNSEGLFDPTVDSPIFGRAITATTSSAVLTTSTFVSGYYAVLVPSSPTQVITLEAEIGVGERALLPVPVQIAVSPSRAAIRYDIPLAAACPPGQSSVHGFVYSDTAPVGVFVYGEDAPLPISTLISTSVGASARSNFAYDLGCLPNGTVQVYGSTPPGFFPTTPETVTLALSSSQARVDFGKALDGFVSASPALPSVSRLSPLNATSVPSGRVPLSWTVSAPAPAFVHHLRLCVGGSCAVLSPNIAQVTHSVAAGQSVTWTLRACADRACSYFADAEGGTPWSFTGFDPSSFLTVSAHIPAPKVRYNSVVPLTITGRFTGPTPVVFGLSHRPRHATNDSALLGAWSVISTTTFPSTTSGSVIYAFHIPSLLLSHPSGYPVQAEVGLGYYDLVGDYHALPGVVRSNQSLAEPWRAFIPSACRICEPPDGYEPDNSFAQATPIGLGQTVAKNLAPYQGTHVDWVRFVVTKPSAAGVVLNYRVVVATSVDMLIRVACYQGCIGSDYAAQYTVSAPGLAIVIPISSTTAIAQTSVWGLEVSPHPTYVAPSAYQVHYQVSNASTMASQSDLELLPTKTLILP